LMSSLVRKCKRRLFSLLSLGSTIKIIIINLTTNLKNMFKIDSKFQDFSLEAYNPKTEEIENISSDKLKGCWYILIFYPADFTFVCPTELVDVNNRYEDFKKLNTEVIGVSTDTAHTHRGWIQMEELLHGLKYPLASDHTGNFSRELGILYEDSGKAQRAAFIVDPDGILRAADIVSDDIGRNASEILRKLKALDFVRKNPGKVCPASWDEGAPTLTPNIKLAGKVAGELKK